jgi:hypothetical protein
MCFFEIWLIFLVPMAELHYSESRVRATLDRLHLSTIPAASYRRSTMPEHSGLSTFSLLWVSASLLRFIFRPDSPYLLQKRLSAPSCY